MEVRDGTDPGGELRGSTSANAFALRGWLHHQRQLAHVAFVLLRDRSGIAQVVVVDAATARRRRRCCPRR